MKVQPKVYEISMGLSPDVLADQLFVLAHSFNEAVKKANKLFDSDQYSEKEIVSVALIGEVKEPK